MNPMPDFISKYKYIVLSIDHKEYDDNTMNLENQIAMGTTYYAYRDNGQNKNIVLKMVVAKYAKK